MNKPVVFCLFMVWLIFFNVYSAIAWTICDTGISLCYDDSGEVPCPTTGELFYGQDAQYIGPEAAFSNNGDGTITDLNTGLTWQQSDDGITREWLEAAVYCSNLNHAGKNDWRLPNTRELLSIVAQSRFDPAISGLFSCRSSEYWSTDTLHSDSSKTWGVSFEDGTTYPLLKIWNRYSRCVRGDTPPEYNYIDNGDGTVTDGVTGLIWQQDDSQNETIAGGHSWEEALAYCGGLELPAGQTGWRLPNVRELVSIVDRSRSERAIDPVFECGFHYGYWSGSTFIHDPDKAFYVGFNSGNVSNGIEKNNGYAVRCVRGGAVIEKKTPWYLPG